MLIVGLGLVSGLGCGSARDFHRWGVERSGGVGPYYIEKGSYNNRSR